MYLKVILNRCGQGFNIRLANLVGVRHEGVRMAEEVLSLLTLSPFKFFYIHMYDVYGATLKGGGIGQLPAFGGVACKTIPKSFQRWL